MKGIFRVSYLLPRLFAALRGRPSFVNEAEWEIPVYMIVPAGKK
jgi:hypothetical protein